MYIFYWIAFMMPSFDGSITVAVRSLVDYIPS
jgi:hypothetical protein